MKILTIGAGFFFLASSASVACEYPQKVEVPDGTTASEEQMITGQRAVKTYMAAMEEYLACLDKETDLEDEETSDEQKAILVSKHNAAVDEMESIAQAFNEQVRAYKAANQ